MITSDQTVEISPGAAALITSIRGLGYSPETALADLIDNSITGRASRVDVGIQWNDGAPAAAVLDNGRGMSFAEMQDALRIGNGANLARDASDLGRFGMGLRPSISGRIDRPLVVATKP